jgi:hypothetical protein
MITVLCVSLGPISRMLPRWGKITPSSSWCPLTSFPMVPALTPDEMAHVGKIEHPALLIGILKYAFWLPGTAPPYLLCGITS